MAPYVLSLEKHSQWCDDVVHTHRVNNALFPLCTYFIPGWRCDSFSLKIPFWHGKEEKELLSKPNPVSLLS